MVLAGPVGHGDEGLKPEYLVDLLRDMGERMHIRCRRTDVGVAELLPFKIPGKSVFHHPDDPRALQTVDPCNNIRLKTRSSLLKTQKETFESEKKVPGSRLGCDGDLLRQFRAVPRGGVSLADIPDNG